MERDEQPPEAPWERSDYRFTPPLWLELLMTPPTAPIGLLIGLGLWWWLRG
jgi:hypothetical protein